MRAFAVDGLKLGDLKIIRWLLRHSNEAMQLLDIVTALKDQTWEERAEAFKRIIDLLLAIGGDFPSDAFAEVGALSENDLSAIQSEVNAAAIDWNQLLSLIQMIFAILQQIFGDKS